ncbi:MAG: cytochrome c [bacterium]
MALIWGGVLLPPERVGPSPGSGFRLVQSASAAGAVTEGKAAYEKYCSECHGPEARGSQKGPSFLNRIYHPNHHADISFLLAVKIGVRQHHWNFGKMPPVPGLKNKDVSLILRYVRALQKKAGIF